MDMTDHGLAHPKPEARKKTKRRISRTRAEHVTEIRLYVFARERNVCRCCRLRPPESMHELVSRSVGGKVSKTNSVAVCGQLGNGPECHGLLQSKQIEFGADWRGAESTLVFTTMTLAASEWLRVKLWERIESPPMRDCEPSEIA